MGNVKHSIEVFQKTRDINGKEEFVINDVVSKGANWVQGKGTETVGDGAANGTSIATASIPAGTVFQCMSIMFSSNLGAIARIGTGTLGSMTDYYIVDCQNAGATVIVSEQTPIFRIDNSSGTSALTLRLYVPKTAKNAATNNDANHYFDAYVGGIAV